MAEKPIADTLRALQGSAAAALRGTRDALLAPRPTTLSTAARDRVIAGVAKTVDRSVAVGTSGGSLLNHVRATTRQIARNRIEHEQLLMMAPEVKQAAAIVVPSIMAPNDLRTGTATVVSTCAALSEADNQRIGEALSAFFNEQLKLSAKLPAWIEEALYRSGAKPLVVVPASELDYQFNSADGKVAGTEAHAAAAQQLLAESLFGLADGAAHRTQPGYKKPTLDYPRLTGGVETLLDGLGAQHAADAGRPYDRHRNSKIQPQHLQAVASAVLASERLSLADNPEILKFDRLSTGAAQRHMRKQLTTRYKDAPFLALGTGDPSAVTGEPLWLELPAEAVIPLYVPGTPSEHIGYFVALDESGNPVDAMDGASSLEDGLPPTVESSFHQMFQAYGVSDLRPTNAQHREMMTCVYQQIVEGHLKGRLSEIGLHNVSLGADNAVYRCMLARYLRQRRTKLLFIPKELLTYFCYKHADNGTGRSKLDEVKFILALRVTLLICRMQTALNNSVDRQQIEATLPPEWAGNPLQFIDTLHQEAVKKATVAFSYDPEEVTRQISSKSFTIKLNGLSGTEGFNVTRQDAPRTGVQVDTELAEDVRNLLCLALDIPPSLFNQLAETEYARSVATTNLIFSRKISQLQDTTCEHLGAFVRTYTTCSAQLRDKLLTIINAAAAADQAHDEAEPAALSDGALTKMLPNPDDAGLDPSAPSPGETLTGPDAGSLTALLADPRTVPQALAARPAAPSPAAAAETPAPGVQELLTAVIAGLQVRLPSPRIAPDKAQFENLEGYISSLDAIIAALFGDDLVAGDTEAQEALAASRALAKAQLVRDFLSTAGLGSVSIPEILQMSPEDLLDIRQTLLNLRSALVEEKTVLAPAAADPGMGGAMGGGLPGGGLDGGMDAGGGAPFDAAGGGDLGDGGLGGADDLGMDGGGDASALDAPAADADGADAGAADATPDEGDDLGLPPDDEATEAPDAGDPTAPPLGDDAPAAPEGADAPAEADTDEADLLPPADAPADDDDLTDDDTKTKKTDDEDLDDLFK